jgi:hypothetical protein|tara:strand:+ start:7762 stop:8004 length:243 start_codon:yes stop_codon:yes gene_type:complete
MKWQSILLLLPLLILCLRSIEGYEGYTLLCLKDYGQNMKDMIQNDIYRQYTGYTDKPYFDMIRYLDVEKDPFPTNSDFFR